MPRAASWAVLHVPHCRKGDGATAPYGLRWQSKACPDTRPLRARELYQEGKEQIFQLCLSSLHFKGCAWVWERIRRVCQSTCKTLHSAAPTARLSLRTGARPHPFPPHWVYTTPAQWHKLHFFPILPDKLHMSFKIHILINWMQSALKEWEHPKHTRLLPWGKRTEEQLVQFLNYVTQK